MIAPFNSIGNGEGREGGGRGEGINGVCRACNESLHCICVAISGPIQAVGRLSDTGGFNWAAVSSFCWNFLSLLNSCRSLRKMDSPQWSHRLPVSTGYRFRFTGSGASNRAVAWLPVIGVLAGRWRRKPKTTKSDRTMSTQVLSPETQPM